MDEHQLDLGSPKLIVDIGVGENPRGELNIDIVKTPYVDLVGSITHLPLKDECADKVICDTVLEHLYPGQVVEALREITRILKNDGFAQLTFPKTKYTNGAITSFIRFLLDLPFYIVPSKIKHLHRVLMSIKQRHPRFYHVSIIDLETIQKFLDIVSVTGVNDILLESLGSGRKAKYFSFKPRIWESWSVKARKKRHIKCQQRKLRLRIH